jgi:DNA-binding NarL/FixJ family response regulator
LTYGLGLLAHLGADPGVLQGQGGGDRCRARQRRPGFGGRAADQRHLAPAWRLDAGDPVVDPEIISQLLRRGRERNPLDALTDREREILSLMAQGYSNDSICSQLFISRRTVESHVSSVFAKLGIVESPESSRRVLAVLAYLQG